MNKREDNQAAVELDEARLEEISGGPIYMQVEGIKGRVTAEGHSGPLDTGAVLGDGSVKFVN